MRVQQQVERFVHQTERDGDRAHGEQPGRERGVQQPAELGDVHQPPGEAHAHQ